MNDHHSPSTSQLLRDVTDDLTVDVDRVVRGGISRGRAIRRRRRAGTALAAAAVVGVIGVAASVGPSVLGAERGVAPGPAGATTAQDPVRPAEPAPDAPTTPPLGQVDADITVAAGDVPAVFADLLGGEVGVISAEDGPAVDEAQRKIVFFTYYGTRTSLVIDRADRVGTCEAQADPANLANPDLAIECVVRDGVELLTTGPTLADRVTTQTVSAWRHGYVVSASSSNAPSGKDVDPVSDVPVIDLVDLVDLVTSDVWFGGGSPEAPASPAADPTGTPDVALGVEARQIPDLVAGIAGGEVTESAAVPDLIDSEGLSFARFRLDGMYVGAGVSLHTSGPMARCREQFGSVIDGCVEQPDGTVVGTSDVAGDEGEPSFRSMGVFAPGYDVYLETFNTADSGRDELVAPEPPLTLDEMATILASDRWLS